MNISIRGKNIDVTPALTGYAQKKLGKLSRFFEGASEIQVMLSVIREEHIVEVTVNFDGLILRGEESTGDMYASIDKVVDKLERQIHKYKTRFNRTLRKKGLKDINEKSVFAPAGNEEEEEERIVKVKRFALKPMDVEEAILQMNLLGHSFFVFTSAESGAVNVLYRRHDGNYGLIQPEE